MAQAPSVEQILEREEWSQAIHKSGFHGDVFTDNCCKLHVARVFKIISLLLIGFAHQFVEHGVVFYELHAYLLLLTQLTC